MDGFVNVYFLWRGRISRKTYWVYSIPIMALWAANEFYVSEFDEILYYVGSAALLYPSFMINIRRSHDRDRTGHSDLSTTAAYLESIQPLELVEMARSRPRWNDGE